MTELERINSMLTELEHDYISYDNLHGDGNHGLGIIESALKKMIPVSPNAEATGAWIPIVYKCPVCLYMRLNKGQRYCHYCGQKIDWRV